VTSERAAVSASHCLGNDTLLFPLWFIWRSAAGVSADLLVERES